MNITPIETIYNGYRFRSRLEARWAVFFDSLNLPYRYEPEGFTDGKVMYLPDFYLPTMHRYIEIKATAPTTDDWLKMHAVAADLSVTLLVGDPWVDPDKGPEYYARRVLAITEDEAGTVYEAFVKCRYCPRIGLESIAYHWPNHPHYGEVRNIVSYGFCHCSDRAGLPFTPELEAAYLAARQARFEHGERENLK